MIPNLLHLFWVARVKNREKQGHVERQEERKQIINSTKIQKPQSSLSGWRAWFRCSRRARMSNTERTAISRAGAGA